MQSGGFDGSRTAAFVRHAGPPEGADSRLGGRDHFAASARDQGPPGRSEGVSGVVLVGDAVHLFVDDAPRRVAEFRGDLQEADFPTTRSPR